MTWKNRLSSSSSACCHSCTAVNINGSIVAGIYSPISSRHWQLVQLYREHETAGWHCLTCSQHSSRVQFPSEMIFFGTAWPSSHCQIEMSERGGGKPAHRSCEKITDHCMKLYCIVKKCIAYHRFNKKYRKDTHTPRHTGDHNTPSACRIITTNLSSLYDRSTYIQPQLLPQCSIFQIYKSY